MNTPKTEQENLLLENIAISCISISENIKSIEDAVKADPSESGEDKNVIVLGKTLKMVVCIIASRLLLIEAANHYGVENLQKVLTESTDTSSFPLLIISAEGMITAIFKDYAGDAYKEVMQEFLNTPVKAFLSTVPEGKELLATIDLESLCDIFVESFNLMYGDSLSSAFSSDTIH